MPYYCTLCFPQLLKLDKIPNRSMMKPLLLYSGIVHACVSFPQIRRG